MRRGVHPACMYHVGRRALGDVLGDESVPGSGQAGAILERQLARKLV
jgi:hypothetical protein